MATVNTSADEDQKKADEAGGTAISGTADQGDTGGVGASGAAAPGQTSQVKQGTDPQASAGYTDVGSYLDANQGGAEQMGNQVAGNLTDRYNQAKAGIDTSANDFINQVNQGYTKGQDTSGMLANAVQTASDPNQVSAFQAQLNNSYTGPGSYGDYGTQQGKVNEAQQYGNLGSTPGGMNVLAQGLEGPQASQGVNQLDTMLLSGSPGASQAIQTASQPYAGLDEYLDQYNTQGNAAIAANTAEANNAAQSAQGNLANTVKQFNTGLTDQRNNLQTTGTDAYNKSIADLRASLQSGVMPTGMGIDQGLVDFQNNYLNPWQASIKGAPGYNMPAANYVGALPANTTPEAPTLANASTSADYAKLAALSKLAGNPIASPLSADTASQAGTYKTPTVGNINNQELAKAMLAQLQGTSGNVGGVPGAYQKSGQYAEMLNRYLGNKNPALDYMNYPTIA